jgi:hypothetical protein
VIALYRAGWDLHLEGAAMIQKGLALGHQGDYREAIPAICSGLSRIDAIQEPHLLIVGKHNLCLFLIESLDWKIGADVVLVSLDLAEVYARAGRRRQVREVLDEVIPLGEALGLRQETLMARLLYEQASRR